MVINSEYSTPKKNVIFPDDDLAFLEMSFIWPTPGKRPDNSKQVRSALDLFELLYESRADVTRLILIHLREFTDTGTPAMKARGRKLLTEMEGLIG